MLWLLGTAETWLDGQRLLLNRRQTEVLALLAMHPEGLSLEHLHALVYGDQAVTPSTLKAEVSHLRSALGGQLASRPYRLTMPVSHRRRRCSGCSAAARSVPRSTAYGGDLLPGTNSPALVELAEFVAVSGPRGAARRPGSPTRCSATASSRRTTPRCRGLPGPLGARATRRAAAQGTARRRRR